MTASSILLALAVAAAPASPSPRCVPPAPGPLDSPYAYASAVVDGLHRAGIGMRRIQADRDQDATEVLETMLRTQEDLACAARIVSPFTRSGSEAIRRAAEGMRVRYGGLRDSLDGTVGWLRWVSKEASAGREPDARESDERLSKAVQAKDEATGALVVAGAEALAPLVEFRGGKATDRLLLTRAERKALVAALEEKFGRAVWGAMEDAPDPMTAVAAAWYRLLADQARLASDAP